jgi:hypothetical protein
MAKVEKHMEGSVCWLELLTTDIQSAIDFYREIFRWQVQASPMEEGRPYYVFHREGLDIAAGYEMREEMQKSLGPHWRIYFAVEDVDEKTEKARSLGAEVLAAPFDVSDLGRMSLLKDPTGAIFALWQAKSHPGLNLIDEHGALGWSELLTNDLHSAEKFYSSLFGWTATKSPIGGEDYTIFRKEGRSIVGMMKLPPELSDMPSHWSVIFIADDCDSLVEKAKALGAKITTPPFDIEEVGRFAGLLDPQGAYFGVLSLVE